MLADAKCEGGHRRATTRLPVECDEESLQRIKSYLDCRSRRVAPPAPLDEAWKHFYEFYASRIGVFLRRCGVPDEELNDCSQDVWQEVVTKLSHFHPDTRRGQLSTWVMTLARNKAVDSFRRRSRQVSERLGDNEAIAPLDPSPDPAAQYERQATVAQVRNVLAELSSQVSQTSFQVLYLRWIEGRPTDEVAVALELTPDQVRFRNHRMKRKFRDLLQRSMHRDVFEGNRGTPENQNFLT